MYPKDLITVRGLKSLPWDCGGGGLSGRCRQDALPHVPRSRTERGRRQFQFRGPAAYNTLPPDNGHHAAAPGDVLTTLVVAAYRAAAREHVNDFMNEL